MTKNCRDCKFWAFDMDLEPFCVHEAASVYGTDINVMRKTTKTVNMRGQPCGPKAKYFKKRKK